MSNLIDDFLQTSNLTYLSQQLRLSYELVDKFAHKWQYLARFNADGYNNIDASYSNLATINAKFVDSYRDIAKIERSWEDDQLRSMYGYWPDQKPNRLVPGAKSYGSEVTGEFIRTDGAPISGERSANRYRSNRYSSYMDLNDNGQHGDTYNGTGTEYRGIQYRQIAKYTPLKSAELLRGKSMAISVNDIYRRCKNSA